MLSMLSSVDSNHEYPMLCLMSPLCYLRFTVIFQVKHFLWWCTYFQGKFEMHQEQMVVVMIVLTYGDDLVSSGPAHLI